MNKSKTMAKKEVDQKTAAIAQSAKRRANINSWGPVPVRKRIVGIVAPARKNTVGVVYIKDSKVYIAGVGENNDYLIESIEDIKKLLTIKNLKK